MRSALARALLRAGDRVAVWNRTSAKAEPLGRDGAIIAADPASAVDVSPIVLVCVDNYEVSRAILSAADVRPRLSGRVLVQFSTGSPQEARESERWARDSGAGYLDCAILAYPDQIGTPEAALLVAGEEATFNSFGSARYPNVRASPVTVEPQSCILSKHASELQGFSQSD